MTLAGSLHGCHRAPAPPASSPPSPTSQRLVPTGEPIFIRIFKRESVLELFVESAPGGPFELVKRYPICKWSGTLGPKLAEGDRQSPEGFYFVPPGRMKPDSKYHRAFNLGFPNAYDRALGRTGSFLMVHGGCASVGCYAMTDPGISELYAVADAALKAGQPFFRVHVFPFRMTAWQLRKYENHRWIAFWRNLKVGYDHFERERRPPDVTVADGRYVFGDS